MKTDLEKLQENIDRAITAAQQAQKIALKLRFDEFKKAKDSQ
jgi:hypothetical protein